MNNPPMPLDPLPPFFDQPPLLPSDSIGTSSQRTVSFPGSGNGGTGDEVSQKISKRPKTGCLTCRLRKKRCDERKPQCATCERLGIECMGYSKTQPAGLKTEEEKLRAKQELKRKIRSNRASRVSTARDDDEADDVDCSDLQPRESTTFGANLIDPFDNATDIPNNDETVWDDAIPEIPRPADTGGLGMNGGSDDLMNPFAGYDNPGTGFEEVWNLIFGQQPPSFSPGPVFTRNDRDSIDTITYPATNQLFLQANDESADTSLLSLFSPPSAPMLPTSIPPELPFPVPDLTYLHHYLNVVLPLQYRFVVRAMADLVAPLALSNPDVLKSTSSLAALHLAAAKAKRTPALPWESSAGPRLEEEEKNVAMTMHRDTIERLRFVSPEELTTEGVVLPALFALSYYLFLGGTSRDWGDVLGISRRCLSAAFTASPEITGGRGFRLGGAKASGDKKQSPWKRYRPLMCAMVWMDIVGSVSQNKVTRLLPIYRTVLAQAPSGWSGAEKRERLRMDKVVGCDDTTFLAIAETVALSEWRDGADEAGCLSLKELLHRAGAIEKILDERSWREDTMALRANQDGNGENGQANPDDMDAAIVPVMSEIFYGSAKVLLATVVHGPYPRVPEVAAAVQETAEALHRLDTLYPVADVNRALIFPITIAGCHCDTLAQQAFFRNRFAGLGAEAEAFGNSKQALMLLEEVWRRRHAGVKRVEWRKVMRDLGWESGILLI